MQWYEFKIFNLVSHQIRNINFKDDFSTWMSNKCTSLKEKEIIASAWQVNPRNILSDGKCRLLFSNWLMINKATIETCINIAIELHDYPLLQNALQKWLKYKIHTKNSHELIHQLSKIKMLENHIVLSIRKSLLFKSNNAASLITLLNISHKLKACNEVIVISEILLEKQLNKNQIKNLLIIRLVALAEKKNERQLIMEYKIHWSLINSPFPFKKPLLFAFQRNGEIELEKHLLSDLTVEEDWVELSSNYVKGELTYDLLKKWKILYNSNPNKPQYLFGLTRCIIRYYAPEAELYQELLAFWSQLTDDPYWKNLAIPILIFMNRNNEEIIDLFEKYFIDQELNDLPSKRAALKYVRSLVQSKYWEKLNKFFSRNDSGRIEDVCDENELLFLKRISKIQTIPLTQHEFASWIFVVTSLFTLALSEKNMILLIDSFIQLEKILLQNDFEKNIYSNELFYDIKLQVQRRMKFILEQLLDKLSLNKDEAMAYRNQIIKSNLPGCYLLATELIRKLPFQEEQYL